MTKDQALQLALEAMGLIGADLVCEASHHKKADRHESGEVCPIQQRWHLAFVAIKEALAEPQQEPVAWADLNALTEQFNSVNCGTAYRLPRENRKPLYTSPPASKPWVGLTDAEVYGFDGQWGVGTSVIRCIETKLKEKNS